MIRPVLEFLVVISNSKLDVIFIADSVSTATVRLLSYATYNEDTIAKKYSFVKFYLHSLTRVLDRGRFLSLC